jgi:hypothetical protein
MASVLLKKSKQFVEGEEDMLTWLLLLTCLLGAKAQDHFGVSVGHQGVQQIIQSLLKNTNVQNKTIKIPKDLHEITIKQKDLLSNPLISALNQISNINLNKDLKIYLKTSDILINTVPDPQSFNIKLENVTSDGFDVRLGLNLSKIHLHTPSIELCESRTNNKSLKCGQGLRVSISDVSVKTLKRPVDLKIQLKIQLRDGLANAKVLKVQSNLGSKISPKLDIDFKKLQVPRIAIIIDGQETELDTSTLEKKLLEKKEYLAFKLLEFTSDFIASDLAAGLNKYLKDKNLSTTISLFKKETKSSDLELMFAPSPYEKRNNLFIPFENGQIPAEEIFRNILDSLSEVIRQARLDLTVKSLNSTDDQGIMIKGIFDFILNQTRFNVGVQLGNSSRTMPPLHLNINSKDHFAFAISEPVLNGALDLANSTGLFKEILDQFIKEQSISLRDLKLHFFTPQSFKFVSNVSIDLKMLRQSFWRNPIAWAETEIGIWLERNNNNSVIYFPLEFEIIPVVFYTNEGEAKLSLKVLSAFEGDTLRNTYNYPSNVGNMYQVVRRAVIKKLKAQMDQFENKEFEVDISKFTQKSGIKFRAKNIEFIDQAYIKVSGDILDVVLREN